MAWWFKAGVAAVFGLAVVAGGAGWYLLWPRSVPPLAANWPAVVGILAGDGVVGWHDGPAYTARFSEPFGIAATADGGLLVADAGSSPRIRRISPAGDVSTLAGSNSFDTPSGVAGASDGTVYVADTGRNAVRRVSPDGSVSTLAGGNGSGFIDGTGEDAKFNGPIGVAVSPGGEVIVADTYNDRVRAVTANGQVRTLAGGGAGFADGPSSSARFDTPCGVAVDRAGNIYVADTGNGAIRLISTTGLVTTVTPLPEGGLFRPTGVAVDDAGTVYVADEGGRIVEIRPAVSARVIAGAGVGFSDGEGSAARFRAPSGIAVLGPARLAVTDRRNALVRIIEARGRSAIRPPSSPSVHPGFDFATFAETPLLWPVHPQEGPFEITGTMGEMRGGEGGERFHAGLDVRAEEGTIVRAVRDGVVADPIAATDFNTLNEAVRIGPLVYVHQRVGRTRAAVYDDDRLAPIYDQAGRLVRMRVKRGSRYSVGEALGTTNAFNHVHLNLGWPREEINPLAARLVQFVDTVQPTIVARGIHVMDEAGVELKARLKGRLLLSGSVHVIVDAWDQVDGNRPQRRLGLYRLGYQVLAADGKPAPGFELMRETLRFDRLAPDEDAARLAYGPGSGIPFFGGRRTRFLYEVTNELRSGAARAGAWDTAALPPGNYTLRVLATDFSGNVAIGNRDLAVTIAPTN